MKIRVRLAGLAAALSLVGGCGQQESGPIAVSAIGAAPRLLNPNLEPLDAPSAFLLDAVAQGLVRFDATGQVEPALAQSWIVSDDGLRYTFRLARVEWANGGRVTAAEVVERLRAADSRASKNPLKPVLGAIAEIEAMTDDVLEISLKAPRPNFLQLLAQPEMAIIRRGAGTGPFRAQFQDDGSALLTMHRPDEEDSDGDHAPDILLRGERAALAVARFTDGGADLVTGGSLGDLPIARAAQPTAAVRRVDPVAGMLGFAFTGSGGLWDNPAARTALAMAVDRDAFVRDLGVPDLLPRTSLVPSGIDELPTPALPAWSANPQPMRRETAARVITDLAGGEPVALRVALPPGPGYRLLFAYLRRDWRAIGVTAEAVGPNAKADLRLIDAVAPTSIATWYLRHFTCDASPICSPEADQRLAAAREAPTAAERTQHLAEADRLISDLAVFIPVTAPIRWHLVAQRLEGFRPNAFGRRFPASLVAAQP
jgi:peptide/nickel transport system substrate-binding protein